MFLNLLTYIIMSASTFKTLDMCNIYKSLLKMYFEIENIGLHKKKYFYEGKNNERIL